MSEDCRAVDETLFDELLDDGGFKEFVNFVRKTEKEDLGYKLALCFRGNDRPQNVIIYYNNHVVWKLSVVNKNMLSVEISPNHARYSKDWKEKMRELCETYHFVKYLSDEKSDENKFENIIKPRPQKTKNGDIKKMAIDIPSLIARRDYFDREFVEGSFKIIKSFIDDFFDPEQKFDYFQDKSVESKKELLEKKRQQELYLELNNTENGLFIYDLEFAQKGEKNANQPDMLGIKYENGKPKKLVLVEVKSTESAVTGKKSGLLKHILGMERYATENRIAISSRIIEANKIMKQYKDLKLRNVTQVPEIATIPIEIRVILTDYATEYFMSNKKQVIQIKDEIEKSGYQVEPPVNNRIEIYKLVV